MDLVKDHLDVKVEHLELEARELHALVRELFSSIREINRRLNELQRVLDGKLCTIDGNRIVMERILNLRTTQHMLIHSVLKTVDKIKLYKTKELKDVLNIEKMVKELKDL